MPTLINPGFECGAGTYAVDAVQGGEMQIHEGWQVAILDGTPWLYSTSMQFNGGACGGSAHVEKIEGSDSLAFFAHDLEWTDQPGKPFDAAVYQQIAATPGKDYSLSAWMLSLCGGSTVPNDCPNGHYMAKMLGIDPTGGTDPLADTVIWVEDRRNFVENGERVGWSNLRLSAKAQAETITLFGRIRSPFQWHGNHAFIDAFSLVEAPIASLSEFPAQVNGNSVNVAWQGVQGLQIDQIPGGTYRLRYDLEFKVGDESAWRPWLADQEAGEGLFTATQSNVIHYIRVRARSEQAEGGPGAWPNHRYPGEWCEPRAVTFTETPPSQHNVFLPNIQG